jgi:uncharacterized RDD family membrane protein YckC
MSIITVQTAHNVTIEYTIASIGDRILAVLIDGLVQLAYVIAFFFIASWLDRSNLEPPAWVYLIFMLPILFYELASEIILEGQSLGKRAMNIKVIMLDGSQPHIANYFLRWLVRLFEVSAFSGAVALVTAAVSTKGQRIGDMAAGTTVVKLNASRNIERPSLSELEEGENYVAMFPEVVQLTDRDVNIAREVLDAYHKTGNLDLIKTMNYQLKEVLGIYSTNNFTEVALLQQLIKDYDNLTSK